MLLGILRHVYKKYFLEKLKKIKNSHWKWSLIVIKVIKNSGKD